MNSIGSTSGIGAPLSPNVVGSENFIRHIGNDKLIFDFKSGSGTIVKDRSREGNDGTLGAGAAAPTWRRNGLYFDGGDYVVLTGINHGISTGELTFIFNLSNYNDSVIFHQDVNAFMFRSSTGIKFYDGTYYVISKNTSGIDLIKPMNLQVTRDSAGNWECYINNEVGNRGVNSAASFAYVSGKIYLGNITTVNLGLVSTMYSFRILNKCLSGIECQQEYLANKFSNN